MKVIKCRDCKWWVGLESECRRYPPAKRNIAGYGLFIKTLPNDFCGEAEPKEKT